jgi:hypothetical protein
MEPALDCKYCEGPLSTADIEAGYEHCSEHCYERDIIENGDEDDDEI